MGIIAKLGRGAVNTSKKIVSYDSHLENFSWIKKMANAAFVPKEKLTVEEMKAIANKSRDPIAFKQSMKKQNMSVEKQHRVWKASVIQSYISFFLFAINVVLLITQFSIAHLLASIGFSAVVSLLIFQGSLTAFQMNKQVLGGISEFLHTPTEWLPNPVFRDGNSKA